MKPLTKWVVYNTDNRLYVDGKSNRGTDFWKVVNKKYRPDPLHSANLVSKEQHPIHSSIGSHINVGLSLSLVPGLDVSSPMKLQAVSDLKSIDKPSDSKLGYLACRNSVIINSTARSGSVTRSATTSLPSANCQNFEPVLEQCERVQFFLFSAPTDEGVAVRIMAPAS